MPTTRVEVAGAFALVGVASSVALALARAPAPGGPELSGGPPPRVVTASIPAPTPAARSIFASERVPRPADLRPRRRSAPHTLAIPRLGVRVPVVAVGIESGGALALPPDGSTAVWYRFGPAPGEPGSAVIAAHVDYAGRPGAFFRPDRLRAGDPLEVAFTGAPTRRFVVVAARRYAKPSLPRALVFRASGRPLLTLVTCGGTFDARSRHYRANVIVWALPAARAQAPNSARRRSSVAGSSTRGTPSASAATTTP